MTPVADKPINKPAPPLSPKGDISPEGAEPSNVHLLSTGLATLLESRHILVPADSRRERQAARRLAARHGVDACLDLARWPWTDPTGSGGPSSSPARPWISTGPRSRSSGTDPANPAKAASSHRQMATSPSGSPPAWPPGCRCTSLAHGKWTPCATTSMAGSNWTTALCCAGDERNREWHAVGLRRSQERRPEPEPTPKPEPWRQEWHFIGSQHNQ